MAFWPFYGGSLYPMSYIGTTAVWQAGATVTPVVASKGSWVNIGDTTTLNEAASGFWVVNSAMNTSAGARSQLVDFGVSSDGSTWYPVVENMSMGARAISYQTSPATGGRPIYIPCRIKSGEYIGARCRANTTATFTLKAIAYSMGGINGPLMPGYCHPHTTADAHPDTYGAVVATSKGTAVVSSASANTYGTAVTFTSSTANAYSGVLVGVGNNGETVSAGGALRIKIDDGTNILYDNWTFNRTTSERIMCNHPQDGIAYFPSVLKAGSTLKVSLACNKAVANTVDVTLHGIRA